MVEVRSPIFDEDERIDGAPGRYGESIFHFLNRVFGAYWSHVRLLMQAWADQISDAAEYQKLRQRLRSGDDEQFRSAFLELYLHECLLRAGYTVTIEPVLPHTSRKPDFYAQRAGAGFYVEAIAPGTSKQSKGAAARRADLFDVVDKVGDPNFLLGISDLKEGPNPPKAAQLRSDLRRWLAGLDPDDYPSIEGAPKWKWTANGWSATFKAIPRKPDDRGALAADRAIAMYGQEASWVNDAPAIRKALATKHHAYKELGAPFIIAVGTYIFDSDRWHSANALYGQEAMQLGYDRGGELVTTRMIRQRDGYFGVRQGWINRNVSAVLLVNQLIPPAVHKAEATLWRHPDPLYPLPDTLGLHWESVDFDGIQLTPTAAPITAARFFGLPDLWPPGEPQW